MSLLAVGAAANAAIAMSTHSSAVRPFRERLLNAAVRRLMGTITHVVTRAPVVALTFDDGPDPEFTPCLLDLLAGYDAHATFFVIGEAAQQHYNILARMAQEGHAIGNHTWNHPSLTMLTGSERRAQVRAGERAIAPYGQKLFRPPYGHQNLASRLDLWLLGYQVITWNVIAQDWGNDSADALTERIAVRLQPGSIVLLHDALYTSPVADGFNREPTLLAVEQILRRFGDHFRFVTVPQLLQQGRPHTLNWQRRPDLAWMNVLYRRDNHHRAASTGGDP